MKPMPLLHMQTWKCPAETLTSCWSDTKPTAAVTHTHNSIQTLFEDDSSEMSRDCVSLHYFYMIIFSSDEKQLWPKQKKAIM